MNGRLKILGAMMAVIGLVFIAGGGYALYKTNQGSQALQAFSAAQNVTLSYNDQGQLVDRGTTEGSAKIMSLLTNDWGFSVDAAELNPNDPLVNTSSEYMYQMATISYHTLNATTTVTFPEDVVVDGAVVTKAGTYDFVNTGKYWTGFDRTNPDRGRSSREDLDRHGACPDRPARCRQRDRLGSPDRDWRGRSSCRLRLHVPPHRPRPGVGDARPDREGQGSGSAAGHLYRLENT